MANDVVNDVIGEPGKALDAQDILNLMAEDDDKIVEDGPKLDDLLDDDKDEKKDKKLDPLDKSIEEDEIEIELKEDDPLINIPRRAEVEKKFPGFYKTFPEIEKAVYREKQFADVFSTPAEAKEALEGVKVFTSFQQQLLSGDIEGILSAVKTTNKEAFGNIANEILNTLERVDKDAWGGVVTDLIQNAINSVYQFGISSKDDQLQIAAQLINRFYFQNADVKPSVKKSKPTIDPEREQINKERQQYAVEIGTRAGNEIQTRVEATLKNTIEKYIDPTSVMTPYIKEKAVTDAIDKTKSLIRDDTRFRAAIDKAWSDAARDNYSEKSKDKIRSMILSKAKTILQPVIRKVKADALKGFDSRRSLKEADEPLKDEKPLGTNRRSATPDKTSKNGLTNGKIPANMSTRDFLMSD